MRNAPISLDVLFISPEGRIAEIVEQRQPMFEDTINAKIPAMAMLELSGGTVERLGIRLGDAVHVATFSDIFSTRRPPQAAVASTPRQEPEHASAKNSSPAEAIEATPFKWLSGDMECSYYQCDIAYTFTLRNRTAFPIKHIKYVLIFYGSDGTVIDNVEGTLDETIPGNLAKTMVKDGWFTSNAPPLASRSIRKTAAAVQVRVLNYEFSGDRRSP
jgi:hypothetical protein